MVPLVLREEKPPQIHPPNPIAKPKSRIHYPLLLGAGVLLSLLVWLGQSTATSPDIRDWKAETTPAIWQPITSTHGIESDPAWSPDGSRIAFSAQKKQGREICVVIPQDGPVQQLTNNSRFNLTPTWSPDSRSLAFLSYDKKLSRLCRIGALGGPERVLASIEGFTPSGLSWSPDGGHIAFSKRPAPGTSFAIHTINLADDQVRQLSQPSHEHWGDHKPKFSPEGRHIAFIRGIAPGIQELMRLDLETGETIQITHDARRVNGLAWSPDGEYLIYSSTLTVPQGIWSVPMTGGEPKWLGSLGRDPSISKQGSIALERWQYNYSIAQGSLQHPETPPKLLEGLASTLEDMDGHYHPGGKALVFISNRTGHDELWLYDFPSQTNRKLTQFQGPHLSSPKWSPDGTTLIFTVYAPGSAADVYMLELEDGRPIPSAGRPIQLTSDAWNEVAPEWSPDSKNVVFGSNRTGHWEIWELNLNTRQQRQLTEKGGYVAKWAPDPGKLLLTKFDRVGLFVFDLETKKENRLVQDLHLLDWGNWAVNDQNIYFFERQNLSTRPKLKVYNWRTEEIREIGTNLTPVLDRSSLAISPDGSRFLLSKTMVRECDLYFLAQIPDL